MDARQRLRQVAIALVGDDDRSAGLGDEEIGAGDADIGGKEFLAAICRALRAAGSPGLRASRSRGRFLWARRKSWRTWSMFRCTAGAMMWLGCSPRNWMIYSPRSVSTGSMRAGLKEFVERDLFRDHRLALGDDIGPRLAADVHDEPARLDRVRGPVNVATAVHAPLSRMPPDKDRDGRAHDP